MKLAAADVAVTRAGGTARLLSALRPRVPIVATTDSTATARRLALNWGVVPVLAEIERRNLRLYGYGVKGFTLSMIETALDLGGDALPASAVRAALLASLCGWPSAWGALSAVSSALPATLPVGSADTSVPGIRLVEPTKVFTNNVCGRS